MAGLECKIVVTTGGIRFYIEGYSDKQNLFLETILNETFRYKIDKRRLEDIYDSYLTDLKSYKSDKPQQVAIYYLGVILTEQMWSNEELISAMKFVTLNRLKTFMKEVLTQTHAECFIFGNVNENKALELSSLVEDRLNMARAYNASKSKVLFILAPNVTRERKLPEGKKKIIDVRKQINSFLLPIRRRFSHFPISRFTSQNQLYECFHSVRRSGRQIERFLGFNLTNVEGAFLPHSSDSSE